MELRKKNAKLNLDLNTVTGPSILGPGGGGGGGHSLVMGYWGCAAGWGRIFTTQLTIMWSPFQAFSIELLEWGRTFSGL